MYGIITFMKHYLLYLLVAFFVCTKLNAQKQTFSISLFYAINEVNNQQMNQRLDSLMDLTGSAKKEVKLSGYADYLADDAYNMQLSKKRINAVRLYMQSHAKGELKFVETIAFGEEMSTESDSPLGEASQRRVDVVIIMNLERKKISEQPLETHTTKETNSSAKTDPIKSTKRNETSIQKNISNLKEGESIAIEGLSFIPGRHVVMKSSVPVLEELLELLKTNEDLKIEIQGHICCLPSENEDGLDYDTNTWDLSEKRAEAIYNYLIRNGIESSRLSYKGYGHRFPKVSPERTPEDEQMNRRVEVKVLEN